MTHDELVTVYTLGDSLKAQIIKNALAAEGIRCHLEGADLAGEVGLNVFEIKVQVPAHDADRARRFIEAHEKALAQESESDELEE